MGWTNIRIICTFVLEEVVKALGVSVEVIKNFSKDVIFNYFNNIHDNDFSHSNRAFAPNCTFNPLDKLIEAYEENKKLYERLLETEKRNRRN